MNSDNFDGISRSLEGILSQYGSSFSLKVFSDESPDEDDLMLAFGLTQIIKVGNKQYWGRELGMCWQLLITELFRRTHSNFAEQLVEGSDQLCDLRVGKDAIDTKYRVGSGDSGTLKKFRKYGARLGELGYRPVLLVLRNDNLPHAMRAFQSGGWHVLTGDNAYEYISQVSKIDLRAWLRERKGKFAPKPPA